MHKLIIKRNSEWNNKGRNFRLFVDGEEIGKIANGETREFEVRRGQHTFHAKIDWCQSKKIQFYKAEHHNKVIEVSGFKYGNIAVTICLGLLLIYYISKFFLYKSFDFLLVIVLIGFLYPLYFLTFGKNRYIRASEVK